LQSAAHPDILAASSTNLDQHEPDPAVLANSRFLLPLLQFIVGNDIPAVRGFDFVIDQHDDGAELFVEALIEQYKQTHGDDFDLRVVRKGELR